MTPPLSRIDAVSSPQTTQIEREKGVIPPVPPESPFSDRNLGPCPSMDALILFCVVCGLT